MASPALLEMLHVGHIAYRTLIEGRYSSTELLMEVCISK